MTPGSIYVFEYRIERYNIALSIVEKSYDPKKGRDAYEYKNALGLGPYEGLLFVKGNTIPYSFDRMKDGDRITIIYDGIVGKILYICNDNVIKIVKSSFIKTNNFKPVVDLTGKVTILKP